MSFMSNSSPLNWHSTLRRLKRDGNMGDLGRQLGIPGRNGTLEAMIATKRRPTHFLSNINDIEVAVVDKPHKPNKKAGKAIKTAGASGENSEIVADAETPNPLSVSQASTRHGTPATPPKSSEKQDVSEEVSFHTAQSRSPIRDATAEMLSPASALQTPPPRQRKPEKPHGNEEADISAISPASISPPPSIKPKSAKKTSPSLPAQTVRNITTGTPVRAAVQRKQRASNGGATPLKTPQRGNPLGKAGPRVPRQILRHAGAHPRPRPKKPIPGTPESTKSDATTVTDYTNNSTASNSPEKAAVHWAGKGGLQHMKLVGLLKFASKHGVDVSQHGQSPKKVKAHLKKHFNL